MQDVRPGKHTLGGDAPSTPSDVPASELAPGRRTLSDEVGRRNIGAVSSVPGRHTLTDRLPLQLKRNASGPQANDPHAVAATGVADAGASLPHLDQIQEAFGHHDVSTVRAGVGGSAETSARALDASAYAYGDRVAFAAAPDLHTAAHEAAHVVQQRGGVADLAGGIGHAGDRHEQHADAVADAVVAGQSAEPLLDERAGSGAQTAPAIQREQPKGPSVDATDFFNYTLFANFSGEVVNALRAMHMVSLGPQGRWLGDAYEAFILETLQKTMDGGDSDVAHRTNFAKLVAPEPLDPMVNRARGHDWDYSDEDHPKELRDRGPVSSTWIIPVATEIANAIARRYIDSATKLLTIATDRWVRKVNDMATAEKFAGDPRTYSAPVMQIDVEDVPAGHPMDVVVKTAIAGSYPDYRFMATAEQWDKWTAYYRTVTPTTPMDERAPYPGKKPDLRPVALDFKAKEGKPRWVEASTVDGKQASAEEVAAALFPKDGDNSDTATQNAYRLIPVPPLWGFHSADVPLFAPAHRDTLRQQLHAAWLQQPIDDQGGHQLPPWPLEMMVYLSGTTNYSKYAPPEGDPISELANDWSRALARASANATPDQTSGKDAVSVIAQLADNERALDVILNLLNLTKTDLSVASAASEKIRHTREEWQLMSLPDPGAAYALAAQQSGVLLDLAEGLNEAAGKYQVYAEPPDDSAPDPAIVEMMSDAIDPYNDALRAIDFPDVARQRMQPGLQRTHMLDISAQELMLHSGTPKVDSELHKDDDEKTKDFDAEEDRRRTNQLAYDLGATRMKMASDPGGARQQLEGQATQVGDLEFDIDLGDKLASLNYFWRLVNKEEDFWEGIGDYANGLLLKQRCFDLQVKFELQVKVKYDVAKKANNRDDMLAARQAFADLVKNEFIPMAQDLRDFVNRTEKHKRWAKIIVGIVIAIAAFALGQWELDAMLLSGAGWIEAGVSAGIVTTTTSMVLEKLILNQDPTLGSIIMGFAGNIGTFMWVGRAAMLAEAAGVAAQVGEATAGAAAKTAETAGKVAPEVAKSGAFEKALKGFAVEVIFGEAFMLVSAEGQSLIDNKRTLTWAESLETGAMGVINIIGMKVGNFAFEKSIDAFKLALKGKGPPIQELVAMRDDLMAAGKALNAAAGGEGKLAKGTAPPRAEAQALLDKWEAYFEKEREVTEQMLDLAEKHPELLAGKAEELQQLKVHASEGEALNRSLRQARALLGVEEIAPGLFRADPKSLDAILAEHKASGNAITNVTTDPVTGQRTLRIVTADGTAVELIEKLQDVGARKPPKVPVGESLHFEQWLNDRPVDTPEGVKVRSRMTEYYARDPEAAISLAQSQYGYVPQEVATPDLMPGVDNPPQPDGPVLDPNDTAAKTPPKNGAKGPTPDVKPGAPAEKSAAQRAYEHYEYTREGKTESTFGDEYAMDKSDFEKWYEAGYEYDPIAEKWVTRPDAEPMTTRAGGTVLPELDPKTPTRSLGEVHSEVVGHELMRKLVSGESEALRVVGIEPPPGYDSRTSEWGLGRTKDGKIVLIRGEKGRVDWSLVPGVEDIAHSHPLMDPQSGRPRLLKGASGDGVVDINALKPGQKANEVDLIYLLPSTGDLWWVAVKGAGKGGHRVYTPYVSLGDGKIGNPIEGGLQPPVEIEIVEAHAAGLWSESSSIVVYKGKLRFWAGDVPIGEIDVYQKVVGDGANRGDWPTFEAPDTLAPLPADHPMAPNTATEASKRLKPIGNVSADTLTNLIRIGMAEPTKGSPLEAALRGLRPEQIEVLDTLAHQDRVKDFKNWLDSFTDDPGNANKALKKLEQARDALADDADRTVRFDRDGTPRWEGDGKKPAKGARPETPQEAKTRIAKEQAALGEAKARALKAIDPKQTVLGMDQWIENIENGLGGGKNATPFFDELAGRPDLDLGTYRPAAEDFLANNRVAPAQKRAILEASLRLDVDPAKFLADAQWLANRSGLAEARANMLNSASTGMLDIEWLRTLKDLSPAELDALGARSNTAWNKMKIAADYEARRVAGDTDRTNMTPSQKRQQTIDAREAGAANKAVNPGIRGVAGELAATSIKLPGGFEIVSRGGPEADNLEPDYFLKDPAGHEADLEVKANSPDKFEEQLQAAKKGQPDDAIERMIKQLKASKERTDPKGRPRKSYLAVSDGLDEDMVEMLKKYLLKRGAMPDEILFMKEADILEAGRLMRQHLGIRQGGGE